MPLPDGFGVHHVQTGGAHLAAVQGVGHVLLVDELAPGVVDENHAGLYNRLILSGKLWTHLTDIDTACESRMDALIPEMAKSEGVTGALKAADQTAWVGRMKNIGNKESMDVISIQ